MKLSCYKRYRLKNYMKALLTATYVCIIIRVLFLVLKILSHLDIIPIKTLILMNNKSEKVHGLKIVLEYYENLKLKVMHAFAKC